MGSSRFRAQAESADNRFFFNSRAHDVETRWTRCAPEVSGTSRSTRARRSSRSRERKRRTCRLSSTRAPADACSAPASRRRGERRRHPRAMHARTPTRPTPSCTNARLASFWTSVPAWVGRVHRQCTLSAPASPWHRGVTNRAPAPAERSHARPRRTAIVPRIRPVARRPRRPPTRSREVQRARARSLAPPTLRSARRHRHRQTVGAPTSTRTPQRRASTRLRGGHSPLRSRGRPRQRRVCEQHFGRDIVCGEPTNVVACVRGAIGEVARRPNVRELNDAAPRRRSRRGRRVDDHCAPA